MVDKTKKSEAIYTALEENISVFLMGALIYTVLEIAFRGYSHWTMSLTGGICCLSMYLVYIKLPWLRVWQKCIIGTLIITFWEFNVGCIVNLFFGWNIWDYSQHPFNIMGQVCLLFSLIWVFLALPVSYFAELLHKCYFKNNCCK
ncbi:MAG: hypothetical protein PHQ49_06835 [Clostridia bacterium]|nr:hypothetical protein [Clostridia bacterium]